MVPSALQKTKFPLRIFIYLVCCSFPLTAVTIEGRLPGEHFREDNPPRFGALMSFVSSSDSIIVLHLKAVKPGYKIAEELKKISSGFKIRPSMLEKLGLIEGTMRWLQYTFHKKNGGGFVYITRHHDWIAYLVIFNLNYETLSNDLPFVDRYIKQLQINESE